MTDTYSNVQMSDVGKQGPSGPVPVQAQPRSGMVVAPPGLEYLTQLDQILVHQMVELLEVFTGIETNNRYVIKNSMGQQMYFAAESTEFCMRQCCGNARGFTINIMDNMGQTIMRIVRDFHCCWGCCWCADKGSHCAMELQVEAPPGQIIGYVRQGKYCCSPVFYIMDANRQDMLCCSRHWCMCQTCCCTADIDFHIYGIGGDGRFDKEKRVGHIAKQWAGCVREGFTNANHYSAHFPVDLDVKMKATMLGLTFMIDFFFFENNGGGGGGG